MGKPATSKRPAARGAVDKRPVIWITPVLGAIGGCQCLEMITA